MIIMYVFSRGHISGHRKGDYALMHIKTIQIFSEKEKKHRKLIQMYSFLLHKKNWKESDLIKHIPEVLHVFE